MKSIVLRVSILALLASTTLDAQSADPLTMERFRGLAFRSIGPSLTTGRIADLEVDPKNPSVWYLAVGSGGLFKTIDRGNTWTPIFDEYPSYSLGVVVVDPRDSNVVWLGTGENTHNRSASWGTGVYKSTDAGATWLRVGLPDSQKIQRILIDPRDSDVVYVASPGPLWNAGGDRGLYKTTDGGANWQRVLHVSDDTGITDAAFKPGDPDVIYAAAYQRRRRNAMTIGGGKESGIFRSTNGGSSWQRIENGIPDPSTRAASRSASTNATRQTRLRDGRRPRQSWRFLPVSENSGDSWTRMSEYSGGDPQYYGETLRRSPSTRHNLEHRGADHAQHGQGGNLEAHGFRHARRPPRDRLRPSPTRSTCGSATTAGSTRPTTTAVPGGTSPTCRCRSSTASAPTNRGRSTASPAAPRTTARSPAHRGPRNRAGIRTSDWYRIGGGDGFQAYFDPGNPEIVYAQSQNGALNRLDLHTGREYRHPPDHQAAGPRTLALGQPTAGQQARRRPHLLRWSTVCTAATIAATTGRR